jgi:hypothetical protein
MDAGFLDKLSEEGLYNLEAAVQARIRQFNERSGNETPNQPHLLHGDRPPAQPNSVPSTIQDHSIERRFHHQQGLETHAQTQLISSGLPQASSGLNFKISVNQETEPPRPGEPPEKSNSMHLCILTCFRTSPVSSPIIRGEASSILSAGANVGKAPHRQFLSSQI